MRSLTLLLIAGAVAAVAFDTVPKAYTQSPVIRGGQFTLWHDPGPVETIDFHYGIGGAELAPQPPFTFKEDDKSGSTPKIDVKDAAGRTWSVKFGDEASPDTFCTRVAFACGYYVEPTYFVAEGDIQGWSKKHFENGRFQLRASEPKFIKTLDWAWDQNPFLGTPELNGLKILMMLLSNWDDKDARDADKRGTNTAIFQEGNLLLYFIDDWGGAMGRWGKYFSRSKWNADSFVRQSANFVSMKDGRLRWGYTGQHTNLLTKDVRPTDIEWLLKYLGRITDDQLRTGLSTSGASPEETEAYTRAIRMRIQSLQKASLIN